MESNNNNGVLNLLSKFTHPMFLVNMTATPISLPDELNHLGKSLPIINVFKKKATEDSINQIIDDRIIQVTSEYLTSEIFEERYLSRQQAMKIGKPDTFASLEEADEAIIRKDYQHAINVLDGSFNRPKKYVFKDVTKELFYDESAKKSGSKRGVAISMLTAKSNLENLDTLLKNTTTSGNAYMSIKFSQKTQLLESICEDMHNFYRNHKDKKRISDANWDRYEVLRKNPISSDAGIEEIRKYENELKSLRKILDSSPITVRNLLSTKGYSPLFHISHTRKIKLIKGFITDVQENLFPEWIKETKKENRRRQNREANERRKEKRKKGKEDNETRVRKYFEMNPRSGIGECASALGLDRKTVRGYKSKSSS